MFSFTNIIDQLHQTIVAMQLYAKEAGYCIAGLWAIHILNILVGMRLNYLGIVPRRVPGLIGIIFSPFLHGDFNHLFFNSIPLFLLIDFMLIATGKAFIWVSLFIIIVSGALTWLVGRWGRHVGASAVIMGYWAFLLVLAFYQPTVFNIIIAVIMLYYLGSLFLNLFPSDEKTSFEGHICGAVAGILAALGWIFLL